MIDSGATTNFIDSRFATLHSLPLTSKLLAETLLLADGKTQVIISKEVQLSCLVAELFLSDITFQVTGLGLCPIILGLPWLKGANPSIDWKSGNITMRSPPLTPSLMAPSQPPPTLPSASLDIDVIDAIAFDQSLQSDCLTSGTLYPSPVQSQHLLATTTTSADTTMVSGVARLKPGIGSCINTITNSVELCDSACGIAILHEICSRAVCHGPECSGSRRAPVESMAVVQSPWRPWTPTDSHAKEERAHMRGGAAKKRTKLKEHADGYHSGAREIRAKGTITGRRRRSSV
ncbi:uncharacterized protein UDID_18783 [Ustilago sp. UG-2017a]|nr:uncharacterized protein UDID_18783 [Ustilago sp. UG-2017a]